MFESKVLFRLKIQSISQAKCNGNLDLNIKNKQKCFIFQKRKMNQQLETPINKNEIIKDMIQKKYNQITESLIICYNYLYLMDVIQHRSWTNLKKLVIGRCNVTDSNVQVISNLSWPTLHALDLWNNTITAEGIEYLIKNEWPQLKNLTLNQNKIGNDGFKLLLQRQLSLIQLNVKQNDIKADGLRLITNYNFSQLTRLFLDRNNIGSAGIKYLIKAEMPFLQKLSMNQCEFGNEGAKHLSKSKWPMLGCLEISKSYSSNKIGMEGTKYLSINQWKGLKTLCVDQLPIISMLQLISSNSKHKTELCHPTIENQELNQTISEIIMDMLGTKNDE